LRSKVTVIPQDPVLFNETLRFNLDPNKANSDERILYLLEAAGMKHILSKDKSENSESNGLDMKIAEGGSNLSTGEKQLLCIVRAILKKNKIVLLDEATANIDIKSEKKIQELINKEF
jgi:ABC-type multidrug transport system fused ATPase/permease subunit